MTVLATGPDEFIRWVPPLGFPGRHVKMMLVSVSVGSLLHYMSVYVYCMVVLVLITGFLGWGSC